MARVKTTSKRSELLSAAIEVFLDKGYERTLMVDISSKAGCSKGTLYSYFTNKQELFCDAVLAASGPQVQVSLEELESPTIGISQLLQNFGRSALRTLYSPRFQTLRRLVFSITDADLARMVYAQTVRPYQDIAVELFKTAMKNGQLRSVDPHVAASHLIGLLESELLLKFLLRALDADTLNDLDAIADRAVAVFCDSYVITSPDQSSPRTGRSTADCSN